MFVGWSARRVHDGSLRPDNIYAPCRLCVVSIQPACPLDCVTASLPWRLRSPGGRLVGLGQGYMIPFWHAANHYAITKVCTTTNFDKECDYCRGFHFVISKNSRLGRRIAKVGLFFPNDDLLPGGCSPIRGVNLSGKTLPTEATRLNSNHPAISGSNRPIQAE